MKPPKPETFTDIDGTRYTRNQQGYWRTQDDRQPDLTTESNLEAISRLRSRQRKLEASFEAGLTFDGEASFSDERI